MLQCKFWWRLLLVLVFGNVIAGADVYAQDRSEAELINFAFSNYLGTGFYSSGGGEVFILKIPLYSTLKPMTDSEPGWVVNYPVTLGTANIEEIIGGEFPDLDDVGTVSLVPGIEYLYPISPDWQLIPFFDLGIARDVVNDNSVGILGAGVISYVNFDFGERWLTLGNRFLYAVQESFDHGNHSNFSVIETGLDYNIPTSLTLGGSVVSVSFYYINYYYLEDLVLVDFLDARIFLENKNEVGVTVSLPKYLGLAEHFLLPDNPRIGLGVQFVGDARLYRLVFGVPFF
jgi:hypothetical protein